MKCVKDTRHRKFLNQAGRQQRRQAVNPALTVEAPQATSRLPIYLHRMREAPAERALTETYTDPVTLSPAGIKQPRCQIILLTLCSVCQITEHLRSSLPTLVRYTSATSGDGCITTDDQFLKQNSALIRAPGYVMTALKNSLVWSAT